MLGVRLWLAKLPRAKRPRRRIRGTGHRSGAGAPPASRILSAREDSSMWRGGPHCSQPPSAETSPPALVAPPPGQNLQAARLHSPRALGC